MSTEISIRKAEKRDAVNIAAIGIEAFCSAFMNDNNKSEVLEYVHKTYELPGLEKELDNRLYFVLEDKETIYGFILCSYDPPYQNSKEKFIKIDRLYLDPTKKGHGYGLALMHHAEDYGKENQADYIWLEVLRTNGSAITFYKKFGMKEFDTNPGKFISDNEIDLWMKKSLQ